MEVKKKSAECSLSQSLDTGTRVRLPSGLTTRELPSGETYTTPAASLSPWRAQRTFSTLSYCSSSANPLGHERLRCWTYRIGEEKSAGSRARISRIATLPPAEPATATSPTCEWWLPSCISEVAPRGIVPREARYRLDLYPTKAQKSWSRGCPQARRYTDIVRHFMPATKAAVRRLIHRSV